MSNPALAVQKAIGDRLVGTAAVTSLVPAASILDTSERPISETCIRLGEDQIVDPGTMINRSMVRIHSTIHIWKVEPGLAGVKAIGGAVWDAIASGRLNLDSGMQCVDCRPTDMRFMRDHDGTMSHGAVVIETLVREVS